MHLTLEDSRSLRQIAYFGILERFFTCVTEVIRILFGFASARFVIGLKIMRHFLVQSEVKSKALASTGS